MTIFNPSVSTNMADILRGFSWPELSQTGFGWIGYGVSEGMYCVIFIIIQEHYRMKTGLVLQI